MIQSLEIVHVVWGVIVHCFKAADQSHLPSSANMRGPLYALGHRFVIVLLLWNTEYKLGKDGLYGPLVVPLNIHNQANSKSVNETCEMCFGQRFRPFFDGRNSYS